MNLFGVVGVLPWASKAALFPPLNALPAKVTSALMTQTEGLIGADGGLLFPLAVRPGVGGDRPVTSPRDLPQIDPGSSAMISRAIWKGHFFLYTRVEKRKKKKKFSYIKLGLCRGV